MSPPPGAWHPHPGRAHYCVTWRCPALVLAIAVNQGNYSFCLLYFPSCSVVLRLAEAGCPTDEQHGLEHSGLPLLKPPGLEQSITFAEVTPAGLAQDPGCSRERGHWKTTGWEFAGCLGSHRSLLLPLPCQPPHPARLLSQPCMGSSTS